MPSGPDPAERFTERVAFELPVTPIDDETRHLRVPGIVSFIGPEDSPFHGLD